MLLQKCNLGPRASTLCYLMRNLHLSKGEETRVWGSQNCDHTRKFHKSKSRKEGRIYTWFNRVNRHSYHFEYLVCFIVLPEIWSLKSKFFRWFKWFFCFRYYLILSLLDNLKYLVWNIFSNSISFLQVFSIFQKDLFLWICHLWLFFLDLFLWKSHPWKLQKINPLIVSW